MDNKKWGKRFSTIFWWTFGIMPLLVTLIQFIGYHLTFNSGIAEAQELADYHNNIIGAFNNILSNNLTFFNKWNTPFLTNAWQDLLNIFNLNDSSLLAQVLSWLTFTFIIHVIFDVIVWLPKFLHSLICKYEV